MRHDRGIGLFGRLALTLVVCWAVGAVPGCIELPNGPADASQMIIRGVTLADWTEDGYSSAQALAAVDQIASLGANTLTIVVTLYQSNTANNEPHADPQLTPTQIAVADIVLRAQSRDLAVSLKIHVDLYDGEWRGRIAPSNPGLWFDNYNQAISPWVGLANAMSIDQFVVGTELAATLGHEQRWRDIIAGIRDAFSGELVYAASWDEARKVPFWDALDVVGVNLYAPVTTRNNAHRFEILRGWQPWLERIQLLHKLARRDILLTEIGYRSVDGAGMHPYDFTSSAVVDVDEQADLYWAALQAVGDKPWIRGMYWWNWLANGSGAEELKDYTPRGKPAENELIGAWR
jgi:hypothetical protein